ncbi:MAG: hypothetical protein RDU25_06335, partial [Patescibacteria group bacterium]|nr:hypothetical protein [Patescibacteria group bacterium]
DSTGGQLFSLHQTSSDSASAARTALYIQTDGTSNNNDYLLKANNGTSDVLTISRQGNVTTTGNLAVLGNTSIGDNSSDLLTITSRLNSSFVPSTNSSYDLGSAALSFQSIYASGTSQIKYVSSTYITVNDQAVCLADGTNCQASDVPNSAYIWTDSPTNNTIYPTTSTRDVLLGGSTTNTAAFIFDQNTNTSTVIIGNQTGNANLLVGTTTYGGGLNSSFVMNGNDVIVQGMLGSMEGLYSATGVRVGTGTTVYGDGNLYKTTSGDFTLALNDSGSSYRFRSGGQESFTVASSGFVGIGVSTPLEALDVSGTVRNVYQSAGQGFTVVKNQATSFNSVSVKVQGKYAYVYGYGAFNGLRTYDITNPQVPVLISSLALSGNAYDLAVDGGYAYTVNDSGNQMQIINISNPANPYIVKNVTTGTAPRGVFVKGRFAYVANTTANSLQIIDIADPVNAKVIKTISSVSTAPKRIYVEGRYMYLVSNTSNDLKIFDVSDPYNPVLKSTLAVGSYANDIQVQGRYAYIACYTTDNMYVVDVSNPSIPVTAKVFALAATDGPTDIAVSGRYAFVSAYDSGRLAIIDVASSTSPVLISKPLTGAGIWDVAVSGRYAYTANYGASTFSIIDLKGTETSALLAHSAELGSLQVLTNGTIYNQLTVGGGLTVGPGGILSQGSLAISSTNTTSTFVFAVSSSYAEI